MDQIVVSPSDVLNFELAPNAGTYTTFNVQNKSNSKFIVKIKTNRRDVYFVKPSQFVLDSNQNQEIAVKVAEQFTAQYAEGGDAAELADHRFLILFSAIREDEFLSIRSLGESTGKEQFAQVWDEYEKKCQKLKLKVHYEKSTAAPLEAATSTKGKSTNIPAAGDIETLRELKSKYDAIVEYTVHLTAERDVIVAQLETLKKEFEHERLKNKKSTPTAAGEETTVGKSMDGSSVQGFSWMVLFLAIVIGFMTGRYVHVNK